MSRSLDPHDPQSLLAHDRFIRGLARALVADPQGADDVAQQAWLAALTHRPPDERLHAWLATLVRNLVRDARRRATRRLRRERLAARPVATPPLEQTRAREAARRAVVDAVFALDEPYRTAIALRFLDGLPPRAIASELGVPVETVRTRIQRGLERLRARLDEQHGGRDAWSVALAPLAAGTLPLGALAGILLMSLKTKSIVAALAGVALSLLLWRLAAGPGTPPPSGVDAGARAAPLQASGGAASQAMREPVAASASSRSAEGAATTGSLLVHVRWGDDTPAADVGVRVYAKTEDQPVYDDRDARTDAAGDALVTGLAPGQLTVLLDRGANAKATIEAGRRTEVTVRTSTSSTAKQRSRVEGIVVGPDDAAFAGAEIWLVPMAMVHGRPVLATHSASDGTFELRDVARFYSVCARAKGFAPSVRHCELLRRAQKDEAPVVLRIKLPALGGGVRGTVRDPRGAAVPGAIVQVGRDNSETLLDEVKLDDGTTAASPVGTRVGTDAAGRFACEGIGPGRNDVVVRAKGFGVWTGQVDVAPGRDGELLVDLLPGVTVRGTAREAAGKPCQGAFVRIEPYGRLAATATRTGADGAYELRDLAAGEIDVFATSLEKVEAKARLVARPGDVVVWDPVLDSGLRLEGRVVDERGQPLQARLNARAIGERATPREAFTDEKGRFAVAGWADQPTELEVFTAQGGVFPCARVEVARAGGEVVITVRDADLPDAFLQGTVLGPDGRPAGGAEVRATGTSRTHAGSAVPDPATGAFRLGPLPAGSYGLSVSARGCATLVMAPQPLAAHEVKELGPLACGRAGTLEVVARREDGEPLAASGWGVLDARGLVAGYVQIKSGRGELETLAPGDYSLQASGGGLAHAVRAFTIVAGERKRLEVTLPAAPATPLDLVAPAGDDCLWLRLSVRDADGTAVVEQRVTRPHRSLTFATSLGLLPGRYRGEARLDSGALATFELVVERGAAGVRRRIELR